MSVPGSLTPSTSTVRRGLTRALGTRQRLARLIDQVAFRRLVPRLLGLTQRAPRLQDELVGLRTCAPHGALGILARLRGLALGVAHDTARVLGGDARFVERAGELGALALGFTQRPFERAVKLREV